MLKSEIVGYYIPKPFGVIHRFPTASFKKSSTDEPGEKIVHTYSLNIVLNISYFLLLNFNFSLLISIEGKTMRMEEGSSGASRQDPQNSSNPKYPGLPLVDFETIAKENANCENVLE